MVYSIKYTPYMVYSNTLRYTYLLTENYLYYSKIILSNYNGNLYDI